MAAEWLTVGMSATEEEEDERLMVRPSSAKPYKLTGLGVASVEELDEDDRRLIRDIFGKGVSGTVSMEVDEEDSSGTGKRRRFHSLKFFSHVGVLVVLVDAGGRVVLVGADKVRKVIPFFLVELITLASGGGTQGLIVLASALGSYLGDLGVTA